MTDQADMTTNVDQQLKPLSEKHRMIIDNALTGMAESKAYQLVYPNCKSTQGACSAFRRVMQKPEAIAYFQQQKKHRETYINEKNQLEIDGIAGIYNEGITLGRMMAITANQIDDPCKRVKALRDAASTLLTAAKDYAMVMGKGAFDPAIKFKLAITEAELKKAQREQDDKQKRIEDSDNIDLLAKWDTSTND